MTQETTLSYLVGKLKAFMRDEERVAPQGARGRVYAAKSEPKITVKARVFRAETGTWEEV